MRLSDDPLLAVFRSVFQNESLELKDDSSFEDVPGWDSVAHMNLITAIEEEFNVKFSIGDIMSMNSVGAIRDVLAKKQGASVAR